MNFTNIISSLPLASLILFGGFVLLTILELVFAFMEKELARRIVKPFCMVFLAVALTIALPTHPFLYVAAYLGAIGDAFLLTKKHPLFFPLGTLSFMIGHVFYYVEAVCFLLPGIGKSLPFWFHIVYWVAILLLALAILKPLQKQTDSKFSFALGGSFYYFVLGFSLILYILSTVLCAKAGANNYMWLSVIGISSFIASDLILGYTLFIKDVKRRDFYIMATYLVGECLIILGFVFTYYANPALFGL